MMIEKLNREQMAAIYSSWLVLIEARDEARRENPKAFAEGREWAAARDLDAVLAAVEFFTWNLALRGDRSHKLHIWREDEFSEMLDHFGGALDAEIGSDEGRRIAAMDAAYRDAWIVGICDTFTLMGGDLVMEEWSPDRGAMH